MPAVCLIIDDNVRYLQQGIELVESISDAAYMRAHPPVHRSGVGPHLRHCLDHYSSLLGGLSNGRVDYDARARDEGIATDRARAVAVMHQLIDGLRALDPDRLHDPLESKTDCGSDDLAPWSRSTLRRELQFLVSHTVHHYALIAMILQLQGITPPANFGVAPSTIRYEEGLTPCAR